MGKQALGEIRRFVERGRELRWWKWRFGVEIRYVVATQLQAQPRRVSSRCWLVVLGGGMDT